MKTLGILVIGIVIISTCVGDVDASRVVTSSYSPVLKAAVIGAGKELKR